MEQGKAWLLCPDTPFFSNSSNDGVGGGDAASAYFGAFLSARNDSALEVQMPAARTASRIRPEFE
jgi:hypothetical protein